MPNQTVLYGRLRTGSRLSDRGHGPWLRERQDLAIRAKAGRRMRSSGRYVRGTPGSPRSGTRKLVGPSKTTRRRSDLFPVSDFVGDAYGFAHGAMQQLPSQARCEDISRRQISGRLTVLTGSRGPWRGLLWGALKAGWKCGAVDLGTAGRRDRRLTPSPGKYGTRGRCARPARIIDIYE
jgi:hypothetical protein